MVEDKVDGYQGCKPLPRLPHSKVHDLIPTFLGQYLEHRHCCLRMEAGVSLKTTDVAWKLLLNSSEAILHEVILLTNYLLTINN